MYLWPLIERQIVPGEYFQFIGRNWFLEYQQHTIHNRCEDLFFGGKLRKTIFKDKQQPKPDLTDLTDDIIPSSSCGGDTKMPKDTKLSVFLFIFYLRPIKGCVWLTEDRDGHGPRHPVCTFVWKMYWCFEGCDIYYCLFLPQLCFPFNNNFSDAILVIIKSSLLIITGATLLTIWTTVGC